MKWKICIVVVLFILSSSSATPAFSAVKAGNKCNKIGAISKVKNTKFTCVMSGKKLVWKQGLPLNNPPKVNVPIPVILPNQESVTGINQALSTLKYPSVGDACKYDSLLAYRFGLVPGYTKPNELRWVYCGRKSIYEPGINIEVDEKTLTPIVPTATIRASDLNTYDSISSATQKIVNQLPISESKSTVKITYLVEPSDYGDYLGILKSDLDRVMNYFEAIGITVYMPREIKIFIGTRNQNLDSLIKNNCMSTGLSIQGGTYASICDDNLTGMVVINVAANVLGGTIYNQEADLRQVTKSREMILMLRWAAIHELYHQFQLGVWKSAGISPRSVAPWITEGSAQTIPFYFLAKELGTPNSYQYLWEVIQLPNLVPPGEGPENGPLGCTNSSKMMAWNTEDSRRQCQYTQGMLIVETFVARYGIDKWVKLVAGQNQSNIYQFEPYFQSITGENLEDFYKLADEHSRNMGYQIK